MAVGTGNEMDTNDPMIRGIINGAVLPNIEKAKTRYSAAIENGRKGGRPAKDIDMAQVFDLLDQGKTYQQIADIMGVSRNTISNRIQAHKKQKPDTETNKNLDIYIDIDTDMDIDEYIDERKVSAAFAAETQPKTNSDYGYTQEQLAAFKRLGF